jgi:hypothetical protein
MTEFIPPQPAQINSLETWWCRSIISRIFTTSRGLQFFGAKSTVLQWSSATNRISLTSVDKNGVATGTVFDVAATELSRVDFTAGIFRLRVNGKNYTLTNRDLSIDAAFVFGGLSQTATMLTGAYVTHDSADSLEKLLTNNGVKVSRPHPVRAILIGLGTGVLLIVIAFILLANR